MGNVTRITNTKQGSLQGVYFEDIDCLVSGKGEAWEVHDWLIKYYSTQEALEDAGYTVT